MSLTLALLLMSGSGPGPSYPPYTHKKLYAEKDIRGLKAPKVEVEKWLSGDAPEMKGKVVLIDIWATWCPPCRELIKELNDWQKKFGDKLCIIGISDESADTVSTFMKKTPMIYNVAVDTKKRVEGAIGVQGIPHVLVLSPDGIVRWQGFPLSDEDPLTADKLTQIIDASRPAPVSRR